MGVATADLLETACARTGLDDFGHETFLPGLDRLVDGLSTEARLNELGRAVAPEGLLGHLANRLQIVDWHRRHPEMGEGEIAAPLFLIGMGRTGTTILHDLLGRDPRHRIPRTWEVDEPCPPPEAAGADTDPRIATSQARIDLAYEARPQMRAMHPMGARRGQECILMTGSEFASGIFLSQYRLPSYFRWLIHEADMAPAYRWHRCFLQLLQWRDPGERWVLKSGAHLWALPALAAEYPDALFVQTHRDPRRVIASLSSLFAAVQAVSSDDASMPGVATDWAEPVVDALDRSVTAREDGTVPADRVLDVRYDEFMADPFATIRSIYTHLDAELDSETETRMRAFLAANRADAHGTHRYSFADTGLDAGEVGEKVARYTDYFDVGPEP
ncbi:MAG: sulfotransferase family protein [Acidimicrobiia bacterium]